MSIFDKDKFRRELFDAVDSIPHSHHISLSYVIFALFVMALVGWVTADIWTAVHRLS